MDLKGKNIILTGASSGIGYELAKLIAKEKCNLALLSRRKEITDKLAVDLRKHNSCIFTFKCDVTCKTDVYASFNEFINIVGKIDIAILNSGVSCRTFVERFCSKEAETTFGVNVMGVVHCMEVLLPHFLERKGGLIVGVSSLAEGRGFPGSGFYSASKAALSLMLESWRIELKKYNIKVITVKPGFIKTPMTDKNEFRMPFLMNAEKGAGIIFDGIKKEKRIIQFPLPTVLGAKLLRIIPDQVFEFLGGKLKHISNKI